MHYVPESEDCEATTMKGIPHDVIVIGSDRDSDEAVLGHLLDSLRACYELG